MTLTINTGTTANAAGTGATTAADAATPTVAVSAGAAGSAAYLQSLLAISTPTADAGASGMRAPLNPEDAEALLLMVESKLDKTASQARGAGAAARIGAAQSALGVAKGVYDAAVVAVGAARNTLEADQGTLATDQAEQSDLQSQSDALGTTIATLRAQIQSAASPQDASTLQAQLDADEADKASIDADLAAATKTVGDDQTTVAADGNAVDTAVAALAQQTASFAAAVGQIATGLRTDLDRGADATAGVSKRRDIAYDEVATIAKRHRADEVDRARQDGTHRAGDAAMRIADRGPGTVAATRGADRGPRLAADYAAAVAAALAIIQGFAAAPPPAVSQNAALEAGGRLRLSL